MTLIRTLAAFAVTYCFFDIAPSFLTHDLGHRLTTGDALNFLTPLAVLPFVWKARALMAPSVSDGRRSAATAILFVASIVMVDGHGMNLAANAVARHLHDQQGSGAWLLDYFFDEDVGHVLAHGGLLGICVGLLVLGQSVTTDARPWVAILAAPCLGFAWFADGVEGQTVPLLLPGAVLGLAWALREVSARRGRAHQPVHAFLITAWSVALSLFAVWWIWHRGFPEFSALGWL